jgi:ATP-dependent DNA ligase
MLAKATAELPPDDDLVFEPKWDGFRCIVFRDHDRIELGSRNDRPLTRYFPELLDPLRAELPTRCVVDGEVVVVAHGGLDFDALGRASGRPRAAARRGGVAHPPLPDHDRP